MKLKSQRRKISLPKTKLRVQKKVAGGATGVVLGAAVGGPIGALLGGVVGTAIGAVAEQPTKKKTLVVKTRRAQLKLSATVRKKSPGAKTNRRRTKVSAKAQISRRRRH